LKTLTDAEFITATERFKWTFAKTMPQDPHEYIVRSKTADDETYIAMFQTIEDRGVWRTWGNTQYQYLYPGDGYYYWKMTDDITESKILNRAKEEIKDEGKIPLGLYHHYKGNEYEIIGFAKHSETLEDMVIYKARYGERGTWVRPLSMWDNLIEVDGKSVKRFEYTGASENKDELSEARRALLSTLRKCEKIDLDTQAKSQRTLLERRIAALNVALGLIDKEMTK